MKKGNFPDFLLIRSKIQLSLAIGRALSQSLLYSCEIWVLNVKPECSCLFERVIISFLNENRCCASMSIVCISLLMYAFKSGFREMISPLICLFLIGTYEFLCKHSWEQIKFAAVSHWNKTRSIQFPSGLFDICIKPQKLWGVFVSVGKLVDRFVCIISEQVHAQWRKVFPKHETSLLQIIILNLIL